jgi:diacylglycerol kinase (ATP)
MTADDVALIYNSNAGKSAAPLLPLFGGATGEWTETAREYLRTWLGGEVREYPTTTLSETLDAARTACESGVRLLIAAGGDGTVSAVASVLLGTETRLGILPRGTTNVLSRELGIPLDDVEEALDICLNGVTRALDVGRLGSDYHFLLNCSVGFDAVAVQNVNTELKDIVGRIAYVVSSLANAPAYTPPRITLLIDDEPPQTFQAFTVIISNTAAYGGDLPVAPKASVDDGWFDICVFEAPDGPPPVQWATFLRQIGAWAIRRHSDDPNVHYFKARRLTVEAEPETAVQIDGDALGTTPITVEVMPRALLVQTPRRVVEPAPPTLPWPPFLTGV